MKCFLKLTKQFNLFNPKGQFLTLKILRVTVSQSVGLEYVLKIDTTVLHTMIYAQNAAVQDTQRVVCSFNRDE